MKEFIGVVRYEYRMSVRRWGLIIASFLLIGFFGVTLLMAPEGGDQRTVTYKTSQDAAELVSIQMIFFPVFAGIFAADRGIREQKLGMQELIRVTRVNEPAYILGKYLGVVLSMLTHSLAISLTGGILLILKGNPLIFLWHCFIATVVVIGPPLFFVCAFSLACPHIMPVRVYQILFTGYWYWGNFLTPEAFPTISGTLLNASGRYAIVGFFGGNFGNTSATVWEAVLNILILFTLAAMALLGMGLIRKHSAEQIMVMK